MAMRKVTSAMILAAGEGKRLRPLTLTTPKALLPVGGIPLIFHTIAWLKSHGVSRVAVNTHHLARKVEEVVGDGSRFGMEASCSYEETLLGTAGGVKHIEHFFDDTFVIVYGDILTDLDLTSMIEYHRARKAIATLAVREVDDPSGFGIVETDADGRVHQFVEKPRKWIGRALANCAVYVLEKTVLDHVPSRGSCDFGYDVFPRLLALNLPVYAYVLSSDDYFADIGSHESLRRVNDDFREGRLRKLANITASLVGHMPATAAPIITAWQESRTFA